MEIRRGLLTQGNTKIGEGAHVWSLPAVTTCVGMSEACSHCYATRGRYLFPAVIWRLAWNYRQSLMASFAEQMILECRRKGVLAVRVHGAGDAYSAEYCRKWMTVFAACPRIRFWGYSRSWRSPEVWEALREWAGYKNVRLWLSADRFTGMPPDVPEGVRVAYLMTDSEEEVPLSHLVFRIRRLRGPAQRIGLRVLPVCPNEITDGTKARNDEVTCGSCQKCLR